MDSGESDKLGVAAGGDSGATTYADRERLGGSMVSDQESLVQPEARLEAEARAAERFELRQLRSSGMPVMGTLSDEEHKRGVRPHKAQS